ncbi:ACP S-malonyltransferase [Bailinhaonella thermotolerans]|uniref:[acyl-carrier-protein] S-malonyltransferase n=2 Tax=Bailinhaonella thermotolerans TaxID=1070861 RepID=A0A3A4AQ42_9ACTN|nr:ACP S-malonyltransferase [Bailinhaonella thermotolerans]
MGPTAFADVEGFATEVPVARRLFAEADEALGYPVLDRFRDAEGDYSEYAQVAFLVTCLALAEWAEREALPARPGLCAGPSFGGKAAAAYVGCLSFADAVWMTARLARCVADYFSREHGDLVTHSFVRVAPETAERMFGELTARGRRADVACRVDRDFFMVTLSADDLPGLEKAIRAAGGLSLYTMRPPMHSPALARLRERAEKEVLAELEFAEPRLPVISDHDGSALTTGEQVRALLLDGFVRRMHWPETVAALRGRGVRTVCVAGPDGLFGRVPATTRNFEVVPVGPKRPLLGADRVAGPR